MQYNLFSRSQISGIVWFTSSQPLDSANSFSIQVQIQPQTQFLPDKAVQSPDSPQLIRLIVQPFTVKCIKNADD
jgi:hypothetical protein